MMMKKRKKEKQEESHIIRKNKVGEGTSSASIGFTTNNRAGFSECDLEDDHCYAKRVTFQGENQVFHDKNSHCITNENEVVSKTNHYVKMNGRGEMFDPNGVFSEFTQSSLDSVEDKKRWKFEMVSPLCFDLYYKFLKTGNKAHLVKSERLFHNG